jgi:hypothetical protein
MKFMQWPLLCTLEIAQSLREGKRAPNSQSGWSFQELAGAHFFLKLAACTRLLKPHNSTTPRTSFASRRSNPSFHGLQPAESCGLLHVFSPHFDFITLRLLYLDFGWFWHWAPSDDETASAVHLSQARQWRLQASMWVMSLAT